MFHSRGKVASICIFLSPTQIKTSHLARRKYIAMSNIGTDKNDHCPQEINRDIKDRRFIPHIHKIAQTVENNIRKL